MKGLAIIGVLVVQILVFASSGMTTTLNYDFRGADSPQGSQPSLKATLEDVAPDTVRLTIDGASVWASQWFFNLDPGMNAANLAFVNQNGAQASVIGGGTNAFKADRDRFFDIGFDFSGGFSHLLSSGPSVYLITGRGLDALDFNFLTASGGEALSQYGSVAYVQGTGANHGGSCWVGDATKVPEPSTLLLLGFGLAGVGLYRRMTK